MTLLHSFPPIADPNARALVLGSMPGTTSLRLRQYYGHPQNGFWKITSGIFGFDPAAPYAERVASLRRARVALWDVLAACERPGSLDTSIVDDSIVPNDFAAFFAAHPQVTRVYFNGAKAESVYRRHVLPGLDAGRPLHYRRLPSTSPAHAGMPLTVKLEAWRVIRQQHLT